MFNNIVNIAARAAFSILMVCAPQDPPVQAVLNELKAYLHSDAKTTRSHIGGRKEQKVVKADHHPVAATRQRENLRACFLGILAQPALTHVDRPEVVISELCGHVMDEHDGAQVEEVFEPPMHTSSRALVPYVAPLTALDLATGRPEVALTVSGATCKTLVPYVPPFSASDFIKAPETLPEPSILAVEIENRALVLYVPPLTAQDFLVPRATSVMVAQLPLAIPTAVIPPVCQALVLYVWPREYIKFPTVIAGPGTSSSAHGPNLDLILMLARKVVRQLKIKAKLPAVTKDDSVVTCSRTPARRALTPGKAKGLRSPPKQFLRDLVMSQKQANDKASSPVARSPLKPLTGNANVNARGPVPASPVTTASLLRISQPVPPATPVKTIASGSMKTPANGSPARTPGIAYYYAKPEVPTPSKRRTPGTRPLSGGVRLGKVVA